MKIHHTLGTVLFAALMAGGGACEKNGENAAADGAGCPHEIKKEKCPFCTPSLVESDGFCGEHGVAEALCHQCRPYLKAAFRAKGDWCAKHNAPDSQCVTCQPELAKKAQSGAGHGVQSASPAPVDAQARGGATVCEHKIERAKCPFCDPSLIESQGFCKAHDVAEALCHRCRPFLKVAFQVKGDWCGEHDVPESQCKLCNPPR